MPAIACRKCGKLTNTCVSDWIDSPDGMANKCYAAYVDGKWVKGCSFDDADNFSKQYASRLIDYEDKIDENKT